MPRAGRREWKRIVGELFAARVMTLLDRGTLEGCCANYARAVQAEEILGKQGLMSMTGNGYAIQHPCVAIARNSWSEYRRFCQELGCTPASRSRVQIAPNPPKDRAKEFLVGRRRA